MITQDKITDIFCMVDEVGKEWSVCKEKATTFSQYFRGSTEVSFQNWRID